MVGKGYYMSPIKRYLSEEFLESFLVDFKNLIKIVVNSYGELDLAIRDNSLNLYYKGNSLAQISPRKNHRYEISIHRKFFVGTIADNEEFYDERKESGYYIRLIVSQNKPARRLLQKSHVNQFCSRVNAVNYGEEIVFEQALITDNMDRKDWIIIDRQISDSVLRGKRLDLLALKQVKRNIYQFIVLEVKLGKNPELKEKVADQLYGYVQHIQKHIRDYQNCYQLNYAQKKELGLLDAVPFETITINDQVEGVVVVSGYSKMAEKSILELKEKHPDIVVKSYSYQL